MENCESIIDDDELAKNDETEAVKQLRKRLFSELKWKVYCRERRNSKSSLSENVGATVPIPTMD